mgnify:CR=1 FL=1
MYYYQCYRKESVTSVSATSETSGNEVAVQPVATTSSPVIPGIFTFNAKMDQLESVADSVV